MKPKSAVSGKSEASIIAECKRGEDAAMRNYENVLEENLPSDLLAIVEMQYAEIRLASVTIRAPSGENLSLI